MHSDFGDFIGRVCHAIKITATEGSPDKELVTQQTFEFRLETIKCQ